MKRSLLVLLLMSLLVSCAKPEKTEARFMLNTEAIYQEMNMSASQKVILFGKSSTGYFFSQKLDSSSEPSRLMEIPNGSWTFYAFAWAEVAAGETNQQILNAGIFGGDVICGKSSLINLNGQSIDVDLNLSGNGCKNFGAYSEDVDGEFDRFNNIVIDSCSPMGVTRLMNEPNFIANITTSDCGNNTSVQQSGHAGSYKIQIKSQNNFEGTLNIDENVTLSSACITRGSQFDGNLTEQIALNLPFGPSQSGLSVNYTVKQYFNSSDCGVEIFNNTDFSQNFGGSLPLIYHEEVIPSSLGANANRVAHFPTTEPNISKLVVKSSFDLVCATNSSYGLLSGGWGKKYYPQAGNGSIGFPYVMCTPQGLNGSQWLSHTTTTGSLTIYPTSLNPSGVEYCPYDLTQPGILGDYKAESASKNICIKSF